MGCLRVSDLCAYLVEPLNLALVDKDAYVRKNAAMCVPKVYEIEPNLVEKNNLINTMRNILETDKNPIVIASTVISLSEINTLRPVKIKILTKNNLDNVLTAMNETTGSSGLTKNGDRSACWTTSQRTHLKKPRTQRRSWP